MERPSVYGVVRERSPKVGVEGRWGHGGVRTLLESDPAVAPQKNGVLHSTMSTMHAHTASTAEGVLPFQNWMLSRRQVDVRRGADLPEPLQERGGACRLQMPDAALLYFMGGQASAEMKVWGESVSRRATRP